MTPRIPPNARMQRPLRRRAERGRYLTFAQYLRFRLGTASGRTVWFNFFIKPFGASSFAGFRRQWNPVYGYFLYYYSYRPLSRVMPRVPAMLITFVACGLVLHDLPAWLLTRRLLAPGATIAFSLFGIGAVLSEVFHMDLSRQPFLVRAGVNVLYLAGCSAAMLVIVLSLYRLWSPIRMMGVSSSPRWVRLADE